MIAKFKKQKHTPLTAKRGDKDPFKILAQFQYVKGYSHN